MTTIKFSMDQNKKKCKNEFKTSTKSLGLNEDLTKLSIINSKTIMVNPEKI